MQAWGLWRNKLDDMHFLKHCIWPLFPHDHLLHVGSGAVSRWGGLPFPPHPPWIGVCANPKPETLNPKP